MREIRIATLIRAPARRCFDLARSVDAHLTSTAHTGERAVGGRTSGFLELGEEVTWEARHLGVRQRLTSRITALDPPRYFQDRMVRGIFASFEHDHHFREVHGATEMLDVLRFAAPLGPLGRVAELLFLGAYLERFLAQRAQALKRMAEADDPGPA
jgi:ligand-binding SRPBCC domain-containing protein